MIYVCITHGLGNQFFQFAMGYSLSKREGQPLVLDTSWFKYNSDRNFMLNGTYATDICMVDEDTGLFNTKDRQAFYSTDNQRKGSGFITDMSNNVSKDEFSGHYDNYYLRGYFQSPIFFDNYRIELLSLFKIKHIKHPKFSNYMKSIKEKNSVAVHIRRGDYVTESVLRPFGNHYLLDMEYYRIALDYMNHMVENPYYFVFTDSKEWVERSIELPCNSEVVVIFDENADLLEFELMKNCKNAITANSTFSWWAAWLNNNIKKIIITPKKRYGPENMIPLEWVKL